MVINTTSSLNRSFYSHNLFCGWLREKFHYTKNTRIVFYSQNLETLVHIPVSCYWIYIRLGDDRRNLMLQLLESSLYA